METKGFEFAVIGIGERGVFAKADAEATLNVMRL
jgi:hypothetical protein